MKLLSAATLAIISSCLVTGVANGQSAQDTVPRGQVTQYSWNNSKIYPGTTRDYWVYVPHQYNEATAASVMVFQDGYMFLNPEGFMNTPAVMDALISSNEMPVTIGIFVSPGENTEQEHVNQRRVEYATLNDSYARFLLEEILPEVSKRYNLKEDAASRAISGASFGGICSFTVAWERPDAFSKVVSFIGGFTGVPGGGEYHTMVRKTRGNPKPIRTFLQTTDDDLNNTMGNFKLGNQQMESALKFARYDTRFALGPGSHDLKHAGSIFADALRWTWRDYPGVKDTGRWERPTADIVGDWNVELDVWGNIFSGVLSIFEENDRLAAQFMSSENSKHDVTDVSFKEGILSFNFMLRGMSEDPAHSEDPSRSWLFVEGDAFKGALGVVEGAGDIDFPMRGRRN
jgi:enterochelin esterase-like enzyme